MRGADISRCAFVCWFLVSASAIGLCFALYAFSLAPSASLLSIAAATSVLLAYAALAWFGLRRLRSRYPAVVKIARWMGLAAGTVFAAEICLEYAFLPDNNVVWGMVEFGAVFFIYAIAGAWLAFSRRSLREAVLGAGLTALLSSAVWCVFLLATFSLFEGTDRQQKVFQAEGEYEDFRHSGIASFQTFVTEDMFGAVFFHLTLGPAVASLLGLAGGAVGNGAAVVRKRMTGG